MEELVVRIGTRKSQLALIQTQQVKGRLESMFPAVRFEVVSVTTTGDRILDVALNKIGEKSLFTKELEELLAGGDVDLVVHSLKDLPTQLPDGMAIAAVTEREDPRDVVLGAGPLAALRPGCVVGTSAVRRVAQLKAAFPALQFRNVRGNLNTRLRKLDEGGYDALILAAAGVSRMGWGGRIAERLGDDVCLHAVGQGALGVEVRREDGRTVEIVAGLNHEPTLTACVAERALMAGLEGGCSVPVAAHGCVRDGGTRLRLTAGVWSLDGGESVKETAEEELGEEGGAAGRQEDRLYASVLAPKDLLRRAEKAERCGARLADKMLERGAKRILDEARSEMQAQEPQQQQQAC